MRAPRGFGRNYFSLSAIQAYSSHVLLGQREARVHAYSLKLSDECDNEEEDDEPDGPLCAAQLSVPAHAGHCNCYYHRITRNRIRLNPKPKLFVSSYRLTESVSSPPHAFYFHDQTFTQQQGKQ